MRPSARRRARTRGPARAAAASSATRTGARRVPGEDGRDLGADGGCVAAAAHRGLLLSYPKADDEPPFEWECGTAYGQQDRLIMDSGVLGNLRPQIGFFFTFTFLLKYLKTLTTLQNSKHFKRHWMKINFI